jgi:hypothetical protein
MIGNFGIYLLLGDRKIRQNSNYIHELVNIINQHRIFDESMMREVRLVTSIMV